MIEQLMTFLRAQMNSTVKSRPANRPDKSDIIVCAKEMAYQGSLQPPSGQSVSKSIGSDRIEVVSGCRVHLTGSP